MNKRYKKVALGGTFDHFHAGHADLLRMAGELADEVIVGVTVQKMITYKDFLCSIQNYETREKYLREAVGSLFDATTHETVIPLVDIFGSTLIDDDIGAIVVTEHTLKGANVVNDRRVEMGKKPLDIHLCPLRLASDGMPISSTRIRGGEINRDGFVYNFLFEATVMLHSSQREALAHPFGQVLSSLDDVREDIQKAQLCGLPIICVGDVITATFVERALPFCCAYIDGKTRRSSDSVPAFSHVEHIAHENSAGTVDAFMATKIRQDLAQLFLVDQRYSNRIFQIDGEEDLLVIPAVMLSPLGSLVFYGQPNMKSAVCIRVTEEKKEEIKSLLLKT